jgi:CHRD domain
MADMISRRALIVAAACLTGVAGSGPARAASWSIKVPLSGANCIPPVETGGSGAANITYDPATRVVAWNIAYNGLSSPATMAHFHGPAPAGTNGKVVIWLTKQGSPPTNPITGKATLTSEQAQQFEAAEWYVNLHTQSHPAGEIRGQVTPPKG